MVHQTRLCYCYKTGCYSREGCVAVTGLGGTADRVVLLLQDWVVQQIGLCYCHRTGWYGR